MKQPLSVVIITLNAEQVLAPCLQSVAFADEIVVVDAGSTDKTVALAGESGANVLHQDWLGYGPQKQFAVGQARHDWVLCIDADERVSDALREAIIQVLQSPRHSGYEMPRCNRFLGRWLRHGEGYPDYNLRLYHRQHGQWSDDVVHEHVVVDGEVGRLHGDLLHESQQTLTAYLEKQNRYTQLQAERLHERGKPVSRARLCLSPLARFIKFFLLRKGFLDGVPGLVHTSIGCFNSFIKYAKLLELQRNAAARRKKA